MKPTWLIGSPPCTPAPNLTGPGTTRKRSLSTSRIKHKRVDATSNIIKRYRLQLDHVRYVSQYKGDCAGGTLPQAWTNVQIPDEFEFFNNKVWVGDSTRRSAARSHCSGDWIQMGCVCNNRRHALSDRELEVAGAGSQIAWLCIRRRNHTVFEQYTCTRATTFATERSRVGRPTPSSTP